MEEKKIPIWLVILLIVVGLCLVGFGIWYGVSYSKESEESSDEIILESKFNSVSWYLCSNFDKRDSIIDL